MIEVAELLTSDAALRLAQAVKPPQRSHPLRAAALDQPAHRIRRERLRDDQHGICPKRCSEVQVSLGDHEVLEEHRLADAFAEHREELGASSEIVRFNKDGHRCDARIRLCGIIRAGRYG